MRFFDVIVHNFWLKVISLILAAATWFYVFDLIRPARIHQETPEDVFARYQFTIKEVPVKLVFTGKTPKGYRVVFDEVNVIPSTIAVYGPEGVVEGVEDLRTEEINLGKYKKTVKMELDIVSDVKMLQFKDKIVDVYIPVEKVKREESAE